MKRSEISFYLNCDSLLLAVWKDARMVMTLSNFHSNEKREVDRKIRKKDLEKSKKKKAKSASSTPKTSTPKKSQTNKGSTLQSVIKKKEKPRQDLSPKQSKKV